MTNIYLRKSKSKQITIEKTKNVFFVFEDDEKRLMNALKLPFFLFHQIPFFLLKILKAKVDPTKAYEGNNRALLMESPPA
jgi:hypothetical protein